MIAAGPLAQRVPTWGLFWLAAGGLAYSIGIAFYAAGGRLRFAHSIWHIFVGAGTTCHYVAIMAYAS